MAKGSEVAHGDPLALLYMVFVFAGILFVPALISRFFSSPEPPRSDSDEGGGGPPRRPAPPRPPRGGIPLDDATPARVRLRDHRRLAQLLPSRERRPAREPARTPARTWHA
jgi:hypothetical protein